MYFAVDPRRVKGVTFPAFKSLQTEVRRLLDASKQLSGFEGKSGSTLYGGLDDLRRAGFLNIIAKCGVTALPGGKPVLAHLQELRDLRGDRFFCVVPQQLRDDVKNAAQASLFDAVSGSLHHPPRRLRARRQLQDPRSVRQPAADVLRERRPSGSPTSTSTMPTAWRTSFRCCATSSPAVRRTRSTSTRSSRSTSRSIRVTGSI